MSLEISSLSEVSVGSNVKITAIPTFEIFFNVEKGFGIYSCENEDGELYSIKGNFMTNLIIGQTYQVEGKVIEYRGEKQLDVTNTKNIPPATEKGIISYLKTLHGLKSKASLIYDKYGVDSISMLRDNPDVVAKEIKGIGKKSTQKWSEELESIKESEDATSALLGYGLTLNQTRKLYEKYGDSIVSAINSNPYVLAEQVKGYGFEKCDRISREIGFDMESPFRIKEGIKYVLQKATLEGHCFLPQELLVKRTKELLSIKMGYYDMKALVKKSEYSEFGEYQMGESTFVIPIEELRAIINKYEAETIYAKKQAYSYELISIEQDSIEDIIEVLVEEKQLVNSDGDVYLRDLFYDERVSARKINALLEEFDFPNENKLNIEEELKSYLDSRNIVLEEKQELSVLEFSKKYGGMHILNGSAGCGKTFTLKIILDMLEMQYKSCFGRFEVQVLAPTGKASKVAALSTGLDCKTIHRGLGFKPGGGFLYDEDNPLEADVVVVDESSMLDISLTRSLLDAICKGTKVILMGDTKQLPSVGAGLVLRDLIESKKVPVVTLNVAKRQSETSDIIKNATNIINGKMIESSQGKDGDAYVMYRETAEEVRGLIVSGVKRVLSMEGYGMDDVQVLCPQKNGEIGAFYINYILQKELNPEHSEQVAFCNKFQVKGKEYSLYFKEKDKVIHTKNNYEKQWYTRNEWGEYIELKNVLGITNGECGIVESIQKILVGGNNVLRMIVKYEDLYVFYDDSFTELDMAYAMTIHKSQGSQWKAVIIPIMNLNYMMLNRNILYTGYTRARFLSFVVAQKSALEHAISTNKSEQRYTNLSSLI